MQASETDGGESRRGISTHAVEIAVAALVMVLGLTILIGSWHLGSGWTSDGPGPGYFPFYISLVMCIAGAGIIVQALRKPRTDIFVDSGQLRQVLTVLVPAAVYVLAVQLVGVYIASAVYIAVFMAVLGKFAWPKSIVAALAIMGVFFAMFEVWFKVPLYKGALNLLQFTGY
jgi:hypothetical protein